MLGLGLLSLPSGRLLMPQQLWEVNPSFLWIWTFFCQAPREDCLLAKKRVTICNHWLWFTSLYWIHHRKKLLSHHNFSFTRSITWLERGTIETLSFIIYAASLSPLPSSQNKAKCPRLMCWSKSFAQCLKQGLHFIRKLPCKDSHKLGGVLFVCVLITQKPSLPWKHVWKETEIRLALPSKSIKKKVSLGNG